jgi:hypothetical protein
LVNLALRLIRWFLRLIYGMLVGALVDFIRLAVRWICAAITYCRVRDKGPREPHHRCITLPPELYQRPDPYLYSQSYLMALGIAVTWDNPDIWLERGGVQVNSYDLIGDTDYTVVVQIWNGSFFAPAPGLLVNLSARDFGVNGQEVSVGSAVTDLPVRAAPGHPAIVRIPWHTPPSGHHCLQATLVWADDANAANNMGQENTDVRRVPAGHSARLTVPVRNTRPEAMALKLAVSGYEIPAQPLPSRGKPERRMSTPGVRMRAISRPGRATRDQVDAVIQQNRIGAFPPDPAWNAQLSETGMRLAPGETGTVDLTVVAPATAPAGARQRFTLSAHDERGAVVGGVTLAVEVT